MPINENIKILVVDDMSTMRRLLTNMLGQLGLKNVTHADNGKTALPLLLDAYKSGKPFEFIMSDWNMPGMTGIEFLKAVRASTEYKTVPFLMITAEAEQKNALMAVKAGVSNIVVKPFTPEILKEKILKILNKS